MKKIVFAALAALLLTPSFSAGFNGIERGDNHLFLFGGKAFHGEADVYKYEGGQELKYGNPDLTGGLQWLHYVSPYIGLGLEFAAVSYKEEMDILYAGPVSVDVKSKGTRLNLMLLLKVNINPQDRVRLYPVLGLGGNYFSSKAKIKACNNITMVCASDSDKTTSVMPAGYAGLGLEADLTEIITFGIEGRYNAYMLNKNKEDTTNLFVTELSFLAKLGFRF